MKEVHFFGCSFTSGDELSDEEFFPWKTGNISPDYYYRRRNKELGMSEVFLNDYLEKNKAKAYPAKIVDQNIQTFNYAKSGASLREMIFLLLRHEILSKFNEKSMVYFQIPPHPREFIIKTNEKTGYQWESTLHFKESLGERDLVAYIRAKLPLFDLGQFAINDFMDLILLKNYLAAKNVPCCFIVLGPQFEDRCNDIRSKYTPFEYLIRDFLQDTEILNFYPSLQEYSLAGGHYNEFAHQLIADKIKTHILSK